MKLRRRLGNMHVCVYVCMPVFPLALCVLFVFVCVKNTMHRVFVCRKHNASCVCV